MGEESPGRSGVVDSLRSIGASGLALLQTRLELFAVEVQEERERLLQALVAGAVAVFMFNLAAVVVTITVVLLVDEGARALVLIGFCLLYGLGALAAFLALRKKLRSKPPLSGTIAELKKDFEWLAPK